MTRKERQAETQRLMTALSRDGAALTITETGGTLDHDSHDIVDPGGFSAAVFMDAEPNVERHEDPDFSAWGLTECEDGSGWEFQGACHILFDQTGGKWEVVMTLPSGYYVFGRILPTTLHAFKPESRPEERDHLREEAF